MTWRDLKDQINEMSEDDLNFEVKVFLNSVKEPIVALRNVDRADKDMSKRFPVKCGSPILCEY